MSDIHQEKVNLLRASLNRDGIKLWLTPYTDPVTGSSNYPEEMINKYEKELRSSRDDIISYLDTLRSKALDNLRNLEDYRRTGLANLKVKVVNSNEKQEQHSIKMMLSKTGLELKLELGRIIELPTINNLKLISLGKVLQDDLTLQEQGIKNQGQFMAILLEDEERNKLLETENQLKTLERTKEAASILCSQDNLLTVADQHGKSLKFPENERKALCLALAIYEKGRDSLNEKKYSEALLFFMESEKQFLTVNSELVSNVDNYALLCLDIAWCYLLLNNLDQLPDAESRLKTCEDIFNRCYGNNLERLKALKGDDTKEQALFTRLYLLKGIVNFHKNDLDSARFWIAMAKDNLNQLKVDEDKLNEVIGMGYTLAEARLALRRTKGDIQNAIEHILQEREQMERVKNEEIAMELREKLENYLGSTVGGSKVDTGLYQYLRQLGYKKKEIRFALQIANNNLEECIQMLSSGNCNNLMGSVQTDYNGASSSSQSSRSTSSLNSTSSEDANQSVDVEKYRKRLNIPQHAEEHLDLTLEEEENFINQYQTLIESLSKNK